MTLTAWFSLLAICCLGAMSPGPSLAVVLKQTVSNSRSHGLAASWFHAAGVGLWAFATISGLAILVAESQLAFQVITWLGAAYLAWIGVKAIRAGKNSAFGVNKGQKVSVLTAGIEGATISLLNPKLAIFFIALFSQFVSPDASATDHLIMTATAALVDGLWYTLMVLLLSHGPVLKTLQKRSRLVNRLTGGVLIALAARVVTL
ncbi:LysE family translocator [Amphritea sp. 2_MG-2023]|jgi:threonine/homoserine/homoserine lactone efflux protein|uniref:LysE family translocator n=1 Tax=Amphritea TaxID=515417 RepID=UPI001C07863A|nr:MULTISPECIES: LysE family translocator [Amphritea]MBU2966615.1 LysE family translocator [Amphritea atlantica]MDO6417526.1 LysE family translocator [Amphritea sp. 2_MG-2023]